MGMLASKYRQSIASIDLLLQIFDIVSHYGHVCFLGREVVESEEIGTEGSISGLDSGLLIQQELILL